MGVFSVPQDPNSIYDAIVRFNADRVPDLVHRKLKRIDESVFAFFRGTDHLFGAAWPALMPEDPGPAVLCCGDLHLENFGAYRSQEGDFRFDINDFDEALVVPCSFDLVRCTASILLAGEEWGLRPLQATGIALAFLDRYRTAVAESMATGIIGEIAPRNGEGPVWDLLNATAMGTQAKLLDRQTELKKSGQRRIIRNPDKHPDVTQQEADKVRKAVEEFGAGTNSPGVYRVLDVAGRIAGIGSLGLRRYLVLIEGGGSPDKNRLLDVKEARSSAVLAFVNCPQPESFPTEAHRVVNAQRTLQAKPIIGLAPLAFGGAAYRMREMVPEESRSSLDHLQRKPKQLRRAVEVVGQLTGWSQLRGADAEARQALARWTTGPGIDAVLAAAVRFADCTQSDYAAYHEAYAAGKKH
jgi:uncharacterized protein (DUF2252 family)